MSEHYGTLRVFVQTANGSLPVEGARVLIEGAVSKELITDRSGLTDRTSLPTAPREESLRSGTANPFTSYRVRVEKEGFYPHTTENVPIFAGVESLQPVNLVGIAEFGSAELVPQSSTDTVGGNPQVLDRERS